MSRDAPSGTVALIFTDVEGSTPLWERDPATMRAAIEIHHATLREQIARHGGYEVKTEGDAFMVTFRDPVAAVRCALESQEALLTADWPAALLKHPEAAQIAGPFRGPVFRGLRVRMGVHVGVVDAEVDPTSGRYDYYGSTVNRAARVMAAAHGGQILVTQEAWALAAPFVRVATQDLGEYRLRGLVRHLRLVDVQAPNRAGWTFPPPRAEGATITNLTPARTPFVGRAAETAELVTRIESGERMVTLLGPGGIGKTRLARAVAAHFVETMPGGVWMVELATTADAASVVEAVAGVLSVPVPASQDLAGHTETLGRALAARGPLLLILDNAEQVAEPVAALVAGWLEAAPRATFVVTTQHRLGIAAEHLAHIEGLTDDDAVALFLDRTRAVRRSFDPEAAELELVRDLARRLDGQPLALELAAARMGVLSLRHLYDRLSEPLSALTRGARDAVARQSTLRAAIGWSWQLLSPFEQHAIVQCAVFRSGFDLEAVEAVLDLSSWPDAPLIADVVQSLVDKSMVRTWEPPDLPGETRLGLYESIRAFVTERERSDPALLRRHTRWYIERGEALLKEASSKGRVQPLRLAKLEVDNLKASLDHAIEGDARLAYRAYEVLDGILSADPGRATAMYERCLSFDVRNRLLAAAERARDWSLVVSVRLHQLMQPFASQDPAAITGDVQAIEAALSDDSSSPELWLARALRAESHESYDEEWNCATRSRELAIASGNLNTAWHASMTQLRVARHLGDRVGWREACARALELASRLGDRWKHNAVLFAQASLFYEFDDPDRAANVLEPLERSLRDQGQRLLADLTVGNLGGVFYWAGRLERALEQFQRAKERNQSVGYVRGTHDWEFMIGRTLLAMGEMDHARLCFVALSSDHRYGYAARASSYLALVDFLGGEVPVATVEPVTVAPRKTLRHLVDLIAHAINGRTGEADLAYRAYRGASVRRNEHESLVAGFLDVAHGLAAAGREDAQAWSIHRRAVVERIGSAGRDGESRIWSRLLARGLECLDSKKPARVP